MLYTFRKAKIVALGADIGADWASPTFTLKVSGTAVDLAGYTFEMLLLDRATGEVVQVDDADVEVTTEIHSPTTTGKVHFTLARTVIDALPRVEIVHQIFATVNSFRAKIIEGPFDLFFPPFPTVQP